MTAVPTRPLRIGTRGSALALVQANLVAAGLEDAAIPHEIVVIETDGDRRAPDTAWGEGAFVAAIERALLAGEVDFAVHSAKDVPTDEDPRLEIAAWLPRADPRDALVVASGSAARSLDDLPPGARIGTDSPRRAAFVLAIRPDLDIRPLHGNVDTRLRRLDGGDADALILAVAGLTRLGREDRVTQALDPSVVPPAPGQGAIAVQVRADDERAAAAAGALDHAPTRAAVAAERDFLRAAGGGCRSPIGALATVDGGLARIVAGLASNGSAPAFGSVAATTPSLAVAARRLAVRLLAQVGGVDRPRVIVTRPQDEAAPLAAALESAGIEAVVVPAIGVEPVEAGGELDDALGTLGSFDWAVVTSANGTRAALAAAARLAVQPSATRWAAVGEATAADLHAAGVGRVWLPTEADARTLAAELPVARGARVLLLRGSLADDALPAALRERGCVVTDVTAYRTAEAPVESRPALDAALAGAPPSAVVFASGSAVRGLIALATDGLADRVRAIPAVCIGPSTARAAEAAGFAVVGTATDRSTQALAVLASRIVRAASPGEAP